MKKNGLLEITPGSVHYAYCEECGDYGDYSYTWGDHLLVWYCEDCTKELFTEYEIMKAETYYIFGKPGDPDAL
jgi:hypothetical protein